MPTSIRNAPSTAARRSSEAWSSAWLAEMPAFNFALFRSWLGLISLVWFATLLPEVDTFFGTKGLEPNPWYAPTRLSLFRWLTGDVYLWAGAIGGVVAAILLMAGRFTRLAGPVNAVLAMSFMGENQFIWNAGDEVFKTFSVLFGFYCLLTPSTDLNVSLGASARSGAALTVGRIWLFRLIQIQLSLIYLITFWEKVPGGPWRDGTATMQVFRLETLDRFYVPEIFQTSFLLSNLMTWATLLLEGLLPVLLWNRRARPYAIAAGVGLHLSIEWSMNIGVFSWVMILGYVSFLSPNFFKVFNRCSAWASVRLSPSVTIS